MYERNGLQIKMTSTRTPNSQHERRQRANEQGQATVEAAFLIPLILLSLLLLIQPSILLYTYMVMQGAAAETCRIVATESMLERGADAVEKYALRRLTSVPQQDNFHVHEPDCTWHISYDGDEASPRVEVQIRNEIKPLPLFDFGLEILGFLNENGNLEIVAYHDLATKNEWVAENELGNDPQRWVERWNDF